MLFLAKIDHVSGRTHTLHKDQLRGGLIGEDRVNGLASKAE